MDIRDKQCIVTGAGRGLGRQIALDLARSGANVHACDISANALQGLREKGDGLLINYYTCDVTEEADVKKMFAQIATSSSSNLDVLINNAGITKDGLLLKIKDGNARTMPLDDFRKVIDVNLVGVFLCAREAAALMASSGGGVIINISSVSRAGNFGQTNYSAAKAGVDAMTITWSKELARHKIRCAAIAPGYINTEMVAAIRPEVLEKITAQAPLRRLGEMSEIAQTVKFIIENEFVNGKILEIDGGLRI